MLTGWTPYLVPDSMLASGGYQTVRLSTLGSQRDGSPWQQVRSVSRTWSPGLATTVALPQLMGPATLTKDGSRLSATWSSLPSHDRLELERDKSAQETDVHQSLVLSRAFVEQTGITSATLDPSDVPGFLSDWAISAENTTDWFFNVTHGNAADFEQTTIGYSSVIAIGD